MDYLDFLLRDGWLDDPADTVRVEAVHAETCGTRHGARCTCTPRLALSGGPSRVAVAPRLDPWLQPLASGE